MITDLTTVPDARKAWYVGRVLKCDLRKPFLLQAGPLLRVRLVQVNVRQSILAIVVHHIVFDGWSKRVFLRELETLYEANTSGKPAVLDDLPAQYADYVAAEQRRIDSSGGRMSLAFWANKLAGAPELMVPAACRRESRSSTHGGIERVGFSAEETTALRRYARVNRVTIPIAVIALFKVLLSKLCGTSDIVIGMPLADRHDARYDGVMGFFLNLILLRTDVSADLTFTEVLRRVSTSFTEACDHALIPYGLLRSCHPDLPPVRVVLNFMNLSTVQPFGSRWPPFDLSTLDLDGELPSSADMSVHFGQLSGELTATLFYKADVFSRAEIARLVRQLHALFGQALARPDQAIRHYTLTN